MPVASIYHIDSIHNPKVKKLLKLQKEQSKILITEFVSEGEHFCELANQNQKLLSLWLTPERYDKLTWSIQAPVKIYLITEAIAKKISQVEHSSGILGVCEKPKIRDLKNHNVLVLDDLQDPGNLGTLMRSAAAFNFLTIIASSKTVSFYNPKVLRSTQGLIFDLNLITCDIDKALLDLKAQNYEIIGTFLHPNTESLMARKLTSQPLALLIGNEGRGLKEQWLKFVNYNFIISMAPNVESLNAAIAGSIIMYQLNQN